MSKYLLVFLLLRCEIANAGQGFRRAILFDQAKKQPDNIPDAIKDKIVQPFFTTKPPGEGTGIGLSLSYDIVVKGHGGSIAIDTKRENTQRLRLHCL